MRFLLFLIFLTGGFMVLSPALAETLLFQPSRGDPGPPPTLLGVPGEIVWLEGSDGVRIQSWWFSASPTSPGAESDDGSDALSGESGESRGGDPAPVSAAVLLLHGNAGDISHRTPMAEGLLGQGISVLLLEYRGYGASQGKPSEAGFLEDAKAGMDFLVEQVGTPDRVVIFGRSMGGAVAAGLARIRPPAALILEASFTSLEAMARKLYPILPGVLFRRLRGQFDTLGQLKGVRSPVLVVHGTRDEIVPFEMGEALLAAVPEPKAWLPVRGAGHNDVFWVGGSEYFNTLGGFIRESLGDPSAP